MTPPPEGKMLYHGVAGDGCGDEGITFSRYIGDIRPFYEVTNLVSK